MMQHMMTWHVSSYCARLQLEFQAIKMCASGFLRVPVFGCALIQERVRTYSTEVHWTRC